MRAIAAIAALLLTATTAGAQQAPTVQRVYSRFVAGPDYKITELDGDTGHLAGVSGGWLSEELFYLGGAFYWLASGASEWDLHYGGVVLGMQMPQDRRIAFGVKGLVGIGEATRTATITGLTGHRDWPTMNVAPFRARPSFDTNMPLLPGDPRVELTDAFFVFEPQATVTWKATNRIRFGVGAGYRFTGDGGRSGFGDRLNGATGSVMVQFGLGGS